MWKTRKLITATENLSSLKIQEVFSYLDDHRGQDLLTVVSDCKEKFELSDDEMAWLFASWYQNKKVEP